MKLVDYTGKLNDRMSYVQVIKELEDHCKYIEYVLVDEDDTELIQQFRNLVLSEKLKNRWWGMKSSGKSKLYLLKASPEIFKYLRSFETFCKYSFSDYGDMVENTNFGINDIAFLDDQEIPLLFTTTHEGFIMIRKDLADKLQ